MNNIVVIGGSGFIGQHLVEILTKAGKDVATVSRKQIAASSRPGRTLVGDYREISFLRNALKDCDAVVHLAHESLQLGQTCDMQAEYAQNIAPATQLMDECLRLGVKRLIFVSSGGTVYGNAARIGPLREDAATSPISLYGTSKLIIEKIAKLYHVQRELPVVVVRPGNAYGPGQVPFKGQGLVATALASALHGKTVNVFGDGASVRDYVHVRDVAKAIADLLSVGSVGETYNIGSGVGLSTVNLLEQHIAPLVASAGYPLQIQRLPARSVDVNYNVLDIAKLTERTTYTPTAFATGLLETWEWMREYVRKSG